VRKRLTIAILAVVLGTLVLTIIASALLIQRAAISTGESELTPEAQAVGELLSSHTLYTDNYVVTKLKSAGGFDALKVIGVSGQGEFSSLPSPLGSSVMDTSALLQGETVSGNVGHEVFVAVPLSLTPRQLLVLGINSGDTAVLVITRHVKSPVDGIGFFLLVAGVVLVIGAAVAAILARRISAPLLDAVRTTGEIASGDLSARVRVDGSDYPELKELAESINTMGESLGRSQGLGRQFLLSVSHELRTPLTSIRGYADALADGTTEDMAGAVAIIGTEAKRMERLVQDLLDLARLDARQFSFHTERIDTSDLVASVAVGFRPEADAIGLELQTHLPEDTELWVDADPDRLSQVVANLIENAFKFANSKVVVGTGTVGSQTVIWIVDDGPGIPAQDLPNVFERHFSSDRVPARKLGTGLGLAIVAELTEAMRSTCTAESPVADGRGTRMTVWLRPGSPPLQTQNAASGASTDGGLDL
jgi:two-component system sensor histidine kinase BaeS